MTVGSRFTIRAETPAYAGAIVRSTLSGADNKAMEDAALLTSEVVADAMTHPEADPELFLDVREGHIYVEVRDAEMHHRDAKAMEPHDSALTLLKTVASSWGTESGGSSRAVWFDLIF